MFLLLEFVFLLDVFSFIIWLFLILYFLFFLCEFLLEKIGSLFGDGDFEDLEDGLLVMGREDWDDIEDVEIWWDFFFVWLIWFFGEDVWFEYDLVDLGLRLIFL